MLTDKETTIAKELLGKGDRRRALLALRRKKYQETLLAKTDAQLEQLERLTADVDFALVQKDVLFGLEQGTLVLKEIHREMGGLEHVEKLMGENDEAIAYQRVRGLTMTRSPSSRNGRERERGGSRVGMGRGAVSRATPSTLLSTPPVETPRAQRDGPSLTLFKFLQQELGEMLGGKMTNQDGEEVEDELEELEREVPNPFPPSSFISYSPYSLTLLPRFPPLSPFPPPLELYIFI